MVARTVFTVDGLELGKFNRNMTYLYGLSDFWQFIFEDQEKIDLLLEASSQKLSDVYSNFLQLCSTISLKDLSAATHQQIKLIIISDTDAVPNTVNTFTLPEVILGSRIIANRPLLPTAYLEADIHYHISTDGTQIQFFEDISSIGFPSRVLSDGSKEYSFWVVDSLIDEQVIYQYYGKLIGAQPAISTDNYKNFIFGLYYLFINGPTLSDLRKGLNLALGIPLARETETVIDIRKYLNTDQWLVITDLNSYLIPFGLEPSVAIGDTLSATQELGLWVEIKDYINDGNWWINLAIPATILPYIPPGQTTRYALPGNYADYVMSNFLKTHTFLINVKTVDFKNLQTFQQLSDIIRQAKPAYTYPIYIWSVPKDEIIDLEETVTFSVQQFKCENLSLPTEKMVRNLRYPATFTTDKHAEITVSGADQLTYTGAGTARAARATLGEAAGSWYFEVTVSMYTAGEIAIGVGTNAAVLNNYLGSDAVSWAYMNNGQKRTNNVASGYGSSYTLNDVIGVLYDATGDTLTFYKNGVSQGQAFTMTAGTLYPMVSINNTSITATVNFGTFIFPTGVPAGANPGVYTPGTYLTRGCPQFTRSNVPYWIAAQTGGVDQINLFSRIFDGGVGPGTVTGYANVISQFRQDTYEELSWLRVFLGQQDQESFRLARSYMLFTRNMTYTDNSGVITRQWFQPDITQRVILLYATTQKDLESKFAMVGATVPTTWSFTLFQPYHSDTGINVQGINQGRVIDNFPAFYNSYSNFFFRGLTVSYLGNFMPKEGYKTYAPSQADLQQLDYLLFIRVYDKTVGVYWVTSNQSVAAPNYRVAKGLDELALSSSSTTFSHGRGYYSGTNFLRGCGTLTYSNGQAINANGINGFMNYDQAITITNIYTDTVNTTPIVLDRSGKIVKMQRNWA